MYELGKVFIIRTEDWDMVEGTDGLSSSLNYNQFILNIYPTREAASKAIAEYRDNYRKDKDILNRGMVSESWDAEHYHVAYNGSRYWNEKGVVHHETFEILERVIEY